MPLYHFDCTGCEEATRRLLEPSEASSQICKKCGAKLIRVPNPPSAHVVEILDSGIMPRKIERFKEAERLYRERSENDPRHKKE